MKKNFFAKSMSALLALIMVLGVMTVLPVSANTEPEPPAISDAKLIPYDLADAGDKLYTINFNGDSAFQPARILGQISGNTLGESHTYTPSADGSEILVRGPQEGSPTWHWWGGTINGLEIPEDAVYTVTYKVKAWADEGVATDADRGKNNSVAAGFWGTQNWREADIYVNYGNNNGDMTGVTDNRRWRLNKGQTGIATNDEQGMAAVEGSYTYFKNLPNQPLVDGDGFMTAMVEYDSKNGTIKSYFLKSGTGTSYSDWQIVQKAPFVAADSDVIGFWTFSSYAICKTSFKDVSYYKGTYVQTTPVVEVGTADQLAALNTTIAGMSNDIIRVKLTANIDMTGKIYTPVSTDKQIRFNGDEYMISNLSIGSSALPVENAGLFATVGKGSTIRNVRLVDIAVYGTEFTGAVVANPKFGDLTLTNVIVASGDVVDKTATLSGHVGFAGGIVGGNDYFKHNQSGAEVNEEVTWKFAYVVNGADVVGQVSAGGLVGASCGAINYDVDYCANVGNITTNGLGTKNSDNQAAGLINARHHGYALKGLAVDGSFRNCFNTGKLTILAYNTATTYAGTAGIVGLYRVNNTQVKPDIDTLEFYNCFDLSDRAYPDVEPTAGASSHASIAVWTAKAELEMTYYTNCFGAPASAESDDIGGLVGSNTGERTEVNSAVVNSGEDKIVLTTGSSTINEMIARLQTAIMNMAEVEMPLGGFNDGLERDYTWYYNNGALVADKGTEAAPYEISTAAQFAALSALTNGFHDAEAVGGSQAAVNFDGKYFKLTADIDLSGYQCAPLDMEGATVVFDGNGKTIKNWKIENTALGGMFASVGKNSTVKNLTLDNVDVVALGTAGMIIGEAKAGLTVTKITIKDTCDLSTSGTVVGGIVGAIIDEDAMPLDDDGVGDKIVISYCTNEADVDGREYVGGIVGKIQGVFDYQISYCANKGDLEATRATGGWFYIGGILGSATRGSKNEAYYQSFIKHCYNAGELKTADTTSYCYAGGIVGCMRAQAGSEVVIQNCYAIGNRALSQDANTKMKNGGIGGEADNTQLVKTLNTCYAINVDGATSLAVSLFAWTSGTTTLVNNSALLESATATLKNLDGEDSTLAAEIAKIDAAIAAGDEISGSGAVTPPPASGDNTTGNTTGDSTETTTTAPETTTAPAVEEKGCFGALNSTYAVIALVAVLGFALVAKKREEN